MGRSGSHWIEARAYLSHWLDVHEGMESAQRVHDMSYDTALPLPTSNVVTDDSHLDPYLDPPFWLTPAEMLTCVKDDLARADADGLTIAETVALSPYLFGRAPPSPVVDEQKAAKKRKMEMRDARALRRSRAD